MARKRFCIAVVALFGAATACDLAQAQHGENIEQRIDGVFAVVPENSLELAVPLSRRALLERRAKEQAEPAGVPRTVELSPTTVASPVAPVPVREVLGRGEPMPVVAAPTPAVAPAPVVVPAPAEAVSPAIPPAPAAAQPTKRTATAARVPRPRPELIGSPLDLVAGAALPAGSRREAPAATVSAGYPSPPAPSIVGEARQPPPTSRSSEPASGAFASLRSGAAPPPPVPDVEAPKQPEPAATAAAPGACLAASEVADRDGDFRRNAAAFADADLCITQTKFRERRRPWTIQTVASTRPGPLWVVIHDDEALSFDNAVQALKTYGGVFVTLDTGGKRNQDGIDPNRNFSDDDVSCPKLGKAAAPEFAAAFKALFDPARPVIALHNNFDGAVPTTGLGHVSLANVPKDMRRKRSKDPDSPLAGQHALVLLAAREPVDPAVESRMTGLSERGMNVVLEPVKDGRGDCSLSNYAVLTGQPDYYNITVHHDEAEKQRKIIDGIMASFPTLAAR